MKKIFSSNLLKIIAFFFMVLDHIGKTMQIFYPTNSTISMISYIFNIFGRITFPIILFLIIEGFYHTHDIKKYLLRLGSMALIIGVSEIIISSFFTIKGSSLIFKFGNIFIDLILSLLFLHLINSKSWVKKSFSILIIAYFIISLLMQSEIIFLSRTAKNIISGFLPQYSFMTPIILIIYIGIFYLIKHIKYDSFSESELASFDSKLFLLEIRKFSFLMTIIFFSILSYILSYTNVNLNIDFTLGTYFFLSSPFIYLYNGKEGKKSPIIKSAYYLFYPFHICIIYLIVYLIYIL